MRRRLLPALALGLAAGLALPAPARAQSSDTLITLAIQAYRRLEYGVAASALRHALTVADSTLPAGLRAQALAYLAASDYYRGRRDSAFAVYRRLVLLDPRARPDPLVFPPDVTNVYQFARDAMKVVAVDVPADTTIRLADERYLARLFASSFHQIDVSVTREDGSVLRTLYAGPISDSLDVRWEGLDTTGFTAGAAAYFLTVTSLAAVSGDQPRVVRVPLDLQIERPDTVPHPPFPDSLMLREHAPAGPGLRIAARGGLVTLGLLALPTIVASGVGPSGPRVAVAGGVAIATVFAFLKERPGRPIPDNIAANSAIRQEWEHQRDAVALDNALRLQQLRIRVRAGPPEVIGGGP